VAVEATTSVLVGSAAGVAFAVHDHVKHWTQDGQLGMGFSDHNRARWEYTREQGLRTLTITNTGHRRAKVVCAERFSLEEQVLKPRGSQTWSPGGNV
jgi:hypothetical protein